MSIYEPLFIKYQYLSQPNLAKPWKQDISLVLVDRSEIKQLNRRTDSSVLNASVEYQNDIIMSSHNLTALRIGEPLR